ncbi:YicC/YloC family endoribonuclease [Bosea rubneri]|uniref:YicC/YloC family endoribonuclease n=1 Tax=Bosea rubneri TaxID=3075434 RepID=A0ABU3S3J5_9HYPH|nr:YicC/YloC family endoribonuclease [Bosea sp. ZW T0_25]MDU0339306.1 YicC/YloC family endoribonuclease [Bosea sp. ZW T0_25]
MAIESMTGFAREARTVATHAFAWEVRSVNGRGLDVRVRVPPGFELFSEAARKQMSAAFSRGTLHVNLAITSAAAPARPRINQEALAALVEAAATVSLPAGMAPASLDGLLAIRGVVEIAEEAEDAAAALEKPVLAALERLVASLKQARLGEGLALETVIGGHLATIARLTGEAENHPARSVEAVKARLAAQVAALLETGNALDAQRLHQEAALLAVRADIREEIDRLHAHVTGLRELLAQGGPIGRKLDFLAQEFGRESSTLCAKAGDPGLSRIGLDLRTTVDQLREQVQNVE